MIRAIEQNWKESLLIPEIIFSDPKIIPLYSFLWFSNNTKNSHVQFFETSIFQHNCRNPLSESILLKVIKFIRLAVLEIRSII